MSKHTISLKYPIDFAGETISALSLRRPKVRDMRALGEGKGSDTDRTLAMIASLAEVDPAALEELDAEDMAAVNDWLEPILDPKGRLGASPR